MHSNYSETIFNISGYKRKSTLTVKVDELMLGGGNPIRLQTMTTTNTNCIKETVEQCVRSINAGAELVRLTTQGVKEVQSLSHIKRIIREFGYSTPIVADIHFNPAVAVEAAKYADKIRINPGNFSSKSRTSSASSVGDDYDEELERSEEKFLELIEVCKANGVAIRVGVNHGSLSQRIMNRFGDTPLGMATAAIEFVRMCHKHNHHQVVVSMKSSNTRIMVQATRLLVKMLNNEGLNYPLHLGVTEAGEGEDGRIKSAVGIGALLIDGIGDTIRVSLTEEPEKEIPVAKSLAEVVDNLNRKANLIPKRIPIDPFDYSRRSTKTLFGIGGNNVPIVMANIKEPSLESFQEWGWSFIGAKWEKSENSADFFYIGNAEPLNIPNPLGLPLIGYSSLCCYPLRNIDGALNGEGELSSTKRFVEVDVDGLSQSEFEKILTLPSTVLILKGKEKHSFYSLRNFIFNLINVSSEVPCIVSIELNEVNPNNFQVISSAIYGSFFIDGLADGLMITTTSEISNQTIKATCFGILQAARVRISKTEFISCPGCGRTLFNLNDTLKKVKERTSHLKGLKIGVMGCIVNGPGEMADADYGYVGAGPGRVTLYRRKEVVKKNVPEEKAVDELINLIKESGDWT
jgi:(E)-4-hydroxy-3-methylbut-2-enyl-diphosphate synthase